MSPDFFIVGQSKCGTTALYEMLRRHPRVFMPPTKEPMYFAKDLRRRFDPPGWRPLPGTLEEYRDLYRDSEPGQLCGDASTLYLLSEVAAGEIAAFNPDARAIAVVREPASLIRSLHMQRLKDGGETEADLRDALTLEERRRRGECVPADSYRPQELLYADHVRYVEMLQRYRDVLPADQILVLVYDDVRADNEATVRRIWRFLGVDDAHPVVQSEANTTEIVRSRGLRDSLNRLAAGRGAHMRAIKGLVKLGTTEKMRRRSLEAAHAAMVSEPPAVDEELMEELRSRFKPEVAQLSKDLDRDLVTLWGYE